MKIKVYESSEEIEAACDLCIKYKLYIEGFTMLSWYLNWRQYMKAVFICFYRGKPVASYVQLGTWSTPNCGTFVKEKHRRKGIGRTFFNLAKERNYTQLVWRGLPGSLEFFDKVMKSS